MTTNPTTSSPAQGTRILLAYFSRAGENYYYGGRRNLQVGNTEVLARMISEKIDCDVYRIQAADPYSDDYDATVARNVHEENNDARPGIANPLPAIDDYDTVLLASPVWNVQAPMIMRTFTDSLDLRDKTIHPVVTYAVSGLGSTMQDYERSCPDATVSEGLAVLGETVRDAGDTVITWLARNGLS